MGLCQGNLKTDMRPTKNHPHKRRHTPNPFVALGKIRVPVTKKAPLGMVVKKNNALLPKSTTV